MFGLGRMRFLGRRRVAARPFAYSIVWRCPSLHLNMPSLACWLLFLCLLPVIHSAGTFVLPPGFKIAKYASGLPKVRCRMRI